MDSLSLRPLAQADAPALRAILGSPEVARWWGPIPPDFPLGDEPEATRLTILYDDDIAGMLQYGEEEDPDRRYAWVDIFLGPQFQNRGIGTEALRRLVRFLIDERGHHRITIDPEDHNSAAIRCYEKVGFRTVGVMERAWRHAGSDQWRNTLFMELVVTAPSTRRPPAPRP